MCPFATTSGAAFVGLRLSGMRSTAASVHMNCSFSYGLPLQNTQMPITGLPAWPLLIIANGNCDDMLLVRKSVHHGKLSVRVRFNAS
jgi:hypothetical protein